MNLILFDAPFETKRLLAGDPRAKHIRKVLRAHVGTKVFVGFVNGPRARAEVSLVETDGAITLKVIGVEEGPPPLPVCLLIGLPRPHTAKRILFEAASMGVNEIHFFESDHGEPSYAMSSLWKTDEWKQRLRLGVEQSFATHLPEVGMHADLQSAISHFQDTSVCLALDNYEAEASLSSLLPSIAESVVISLGSERGWSSSERDTFRKNGWKLGHLGAHVLRLETACSAAVAAVSSSTGYYQSQTTTKL